MEDPHMNHTDNLIADIHNDYIDDVLELMDLTESLMDEYLDSFIAFIDSGKVSDNSLSNLLKANRDYKYDQYLKQRRVAWTTVFGNK